jgi:SAM-dependent methyltransferase
MSDLLAKEEREKYQYLWKHLPDYREISPGKEFFQDFLKFFTSKVYTNNLKNREFDKEAPQIFCSERVTIAERQGASENEKCEAKTTQSKTDSSSCLCISKGNSIIDFGCGTGQVAKDFLAQELKVTLIDHAENCLDEEISLLTKLFPEKIQFVEACLWDLPDHLKPADWIFCCDVLEHIPESQVERVLSGMAQRTLKGGFLSICLAEDLFGHKAMGIPLHLTVNDQSWWETKIAAHWKILDSRLLHEDQWLNLCVGKPCKD